MDKTIRQIQGEAEAVKVKIVEVLKEFFEENPSICLSGEFGIIKEYVSDCFSEPMLTGAKVDLTLNINVDEK